MPNRRVVEETPSTTSEETFTSRTPQTRSNGGNLNMNKHLNAAAYQSTRRYGHQQLDNQHHAAAKQAESIESKTDKLINEFDSLADGTFGTVLELFGVTAKTFAAIHPGRIDEEEMGQLFDDVNGDIDKFEKKLLALSKDVKELAQTLKGASQKY